MRKKWFLILVLMLVVSTDLLAQGCAMCGAMVEGGDNGTGAVGRGLNTGILFLMTIPYIILFLLFRKQIVKFFRSLKPVKKSI
jgi:ABC-type glycerol-3-phosphate transport system permease component